MVDPRPGVARETVDAWLNASFTVPLSLRGDAMQAHRDQRTADLHDAVLESLPRDRDRKGLLELCELARRRLISESKAATWPTASEVLAAFALASGARPGQPEAKSGSGGWPHRNSEFVIEATARRVRQFADWPGNLTYPHQVARELVERGLCTMAELIKAGYRATAAERKAAGVVHVPTQDVLEGFES